MQIGGISAAQGGIDLTSSDRAAAAAAAQPPAVTQAYSTTATQPDPGVVVSLSPLAIALCGSYVG